MTPTIRRTLGAVTAGALALGGLALTAAPASAQVWDPSTISDATLTWGMSGETGGGAFFGGCNFLSAGTAGNTTASRVWTEADGFFKTTDGNVTITKNDAANGVTNATWANKCQDADGKAVSASSTTSLTGIRAVVSGGTGKIAEDGAYSVSWNGSFTVVFYGGLTYWSASDLKLTADADGDGKLTATASGYGASMEDAGKWVALTPRTITLANIKGGVAGDWGIPSVTPEYKGVKVTTATTPQTTTGANWGSFPQDFIDFQNETGQSSYWYSSGGARDAAKPTTPLVVSWKTTTDPVTPTEPADGSKEIGVTVPTVEVPATGAFSWAFADSKAVDLGTATKVGETFTASGDLTQVKVTDTRAGGSGAYTWSISGQVSKFSGSAGEFGGASLGWLPRVSNAGTGVTPGSEVKASTAATGGLASSATLAKSTGAASADVDAKLNLVIPGSAKAGKYTATLTLTALS
ncbi:hypothetical protein GCM10027515_05110 [Schumannella luteola]|uniref:Htaa domain-containing protein n=1 Tax=Schumannella luteola TaxID=472059 RepID=A0A852Y912_9MICO|nr:hypothetical protein [Schumannella luteola]NYG98352.1 hypothetical protein [Schumannella luteola]TPX05773.1 hypothetical protein FJ656_04940 [Schumannella luteola]